MQLAKKDAYPNLTNCISWDRKPICYGITIRRKHDAFDWGVNITLYGRGVSITPLLSDVCVSGI